MSREMNILGHTVSKWFNVVSINNCVGYLYNPRYSIAKHHLTMVNIAILKSRNGSGVFVCKIYISGRSVWRLFTRRHTKATHTYKNIRLVHWIYNWQALIYCYLYFDYRIEKRELLKRINSWKGGGGEETTTGTGRWAFFRCFQPLTSYCESWFFFWLLIRERIR